MLGRDCDRGGNDELDHQEHLTLSLQAYARLMKLLPKLSGLTNHHRLKVLGEIDRVLAAERLMWADVAAALLPPETRMPAAHLLVMVDHVEQENNLRQTYESYLHLTPNATKFLADLRGRAAESDPVYLTPRQGAWLQALHDQAKRERVRFDEQRQRTDQWRERKAEEELKAASGTLH